MSSGDFLRDKLSEGVLGSVYNMYNSDALCQIVDTEGRTGREGRGGRMSKKHAKTHRRTLARRRAVSMNQKLPQNSIPIV